MASGTIPPMPSPVAPDHRLESIDVTRGFVLLGILLVNILAFGLPGRAYFDPSVDGSVAGIDFGVYFAVDLLFEGAMRALFSMLFGAGIIILSTGDREKGIYYRRHVVLLGFGVLNAFALLWTGDILVCYALAGMVLYLCRNWKPRSLLIATSVAVAYLAALYTLFFVAFGRVVARTGSESAFAIPIERLVREATKFEGSYVEALAANAEHVLENYFPVLPMFAFWDVAACMFLGMALFKTGVLQGRRSMRFYTLLAMAGAAVGLVVNGFELSMKIGSEYAWRWVSGVSVPTYDIGRVAMALGFASLIVIACRRGWFARLRRWLAAVGRMALTNYILQSVAGFVVFRELGFGLWNELDRHQLYFVVAAQWIALTWFSVWWLRRYRFGPLEWLWRSLTYKRLQPMRIHIGPCGGAAIDTNRGRGQHPG